VPYLLLRGTVTLIARRLMHPPAAVEGAMTEPPRNRRESDANRR
jgi:hypothetical protein